MGGHRQSVRAIASQQAPFAGAAALGWIAMLVGTSLDWSQYALSVALLGIALAIPLAGAAGGRLKRATIVIGSLILLIALALLRNSAGGSTSGVSVLALIPVFYTALNTQSRRQLVVILAGVALFYLGPMLLIGPPAYPHAQYRAALLSVAVSSIIGLATQRLVGAARFQAGEARRREHMLERVTAVVHGLFDSSQPRVDVCEAAREISGATAALLYEPDGSSELLRCTAAAGIGGAAPVGKAAGSKSNAVYEALASGRPALVRADAGAPGDRSSGASQSRTILYQPLRKGEVRLGVLVIIWPGDVVAGDPKATVSALLAHEAAAVISRADVVDDLYDAAQTDALTGLPNRRAWDADLKHSLSEDRQIAIAMLDFDHFKEFNDTYGHPAGDRLLKEAAAAWRDQLRAGDLLARVGGEEFALMLLDCEIDTATEVVERLRASMPQGRTCSAGMAARLDGESAESIIARADRALYRAKADGRNRVALAPA
ncbi:MAG: diguanylate cyclase domain-containing protein [Solirubrobacteraceae bacterium]